MSGLNTGLIVKSNKQGHRVVRLHYSADPAKNPETNDGKIWFEKETAKYLNGVHDLKWRREYEIDFSAGSGELVFPTFMDDKRKLVISPFDIDDTFVLYGGLDWGTRNPVSFHVYAESVDKRFFAIWEYYDQRKTVTEVCQAVRECPFYDKLQFIFADPTIWSETVARKDGFTSIAEMMQDPDEVGEFIITKLSPAHGRSDEACINKLRNMWIVNPPKFQIFSSCPNLINELNSLKYPERKDVVNEAEKIVDKNNHAWDDMKYFVLSHPYAKTISGKLSFGTLEYHNRAAEIASQISSDTGRDYQSVFNDIYGQEL